MSAFKAVSVYSEVAYKNGRKVKDVEIVKENNNGILRQFVKNGMQSRRSPNKHVHFATNGLSKRNSPQLGISFRRVPTPYFTRKVKKIKGLRNAGHRKQRK